METKNNEVVKTKKVEFYGKERDINLTSMELNMIEDEVRIAKLNGRTLEQLLPSANCYLRKYWQEVYEDAWERIEAKVEVGMGATMNLWSDRRAMTITKVFSPRRIEVTENETECIDYYAGTYKVLDTLAEYMSKTIFTLRKNGTWVQEGQPKKYGSVTLSVGFRHHYIDPSF